MKFHLEGLNGKQIQILRKFGKEFDQRGFYLGGGTALAVYFGHRLSVDLDWFTSKRDGRCASSGRISSQGWFGFHDHAKRAGYVTWHTHGRAHFLFGISLSTPAISNNMERDELLAGFFR